MKRRLKRPRAAESVVDALPAPPPAVPGRALARQPRAGTAVAAAAGRPCPLCASPTRDVELIEVAVGPVYMKVCRVCAEPVWNALGLFDWVRRRLG